MRSYQCKPFFRKILHGNGKNGSKEVKIEFKMMKRKDIEQLQSAGLITPEQAVAIAEHFHLNASRGHQYVVRIMAGLAGALILGGIVMLISANWELIPNAVKMSVAMLLLLGAWLVWLRMRVNHPYVAEVFALIGGGMWLGCIALYGQIFQLQNPFAEGCLLFFLGVVAIPFIVRSQVLMLLVAVTSCVLLGALADNRETWLSLAPWLHDDSALVAAMGLVFMLWWVLAERWRGAKGFYRYYAWLSIPALLSYLWMVQVPLFYHGVGSVEKGAVVPSLLGAIPVLLAVARPRAYEWRHWWIVVLLFSLPLPMGYWCEAELLGVLCGFGIGAGLMYVGSCVKRLAWVNYGAMVVLLAGFALIANVLDSLSGSGLVLIFAGLMMLGLVWLLEKQRRELAKSIKGDK